jgi:hypothetical protein
VAENADEDGNCDWKDNEQPDVVQHSDQLLMGHVYRDRLPINIVTGGQALLDTLHGVAQLVWQLDGVRFVVWLNPFWGPIADDGKNFEQMKAYQDVKKRSETVVNMPAFGDELFPQDIAAT